MTDLPARVRINEDGPREGIQIEPTVIPTADKIALIDALSLTGLPEIQTVSFVSPKRVPQWADAEAVVAGIRLAEGVTYTGLCLNEQGVARALATGRLHVEGTIGLCASAAFLARNQNATPARQRERAHGMALMMQGAGIAVNKANVSAAFGCNFEGDIPVAQVLATLDDALAIAAHIGLTLTAIGLSDTMGWATPQTVTKVVGAIRERHPEMAISLHLHDTRGLAIANAYAGLQLGVAEFDTSIGGIGGCPFAAHKGAAGNLCTEDFAFLCEEMGIQTGLDLAALIEASDVAERAVRHPLPGAVRKGGVLTDIRSHLRCA
ncbi:hydroxymethylglutaryl-CoA lyase [Ancylobacter terrae]|uniref:hydroxymethylglutaryl-CoA lyase n=1 Tax=Ancylobacter sp. sgz301288 TaxID=3342077 RepID=UPI003859B67E